MTDIFSKEKRSEIMSKIQGGLKNNSIERIVHNWLKGNRIRHKLYPKIEGSPDVYLKDANTYVFIDGCFWHGCPEHYREPKSNRSYSIAKIKRNKSKDRDRAKLPYKWIRIWEHDVRSGEFKEKILCLF